MRLFFSIKILFLITCLQVTGLYIFLKGFLLTRQTFNLKGHEYSSWERFPLSQPKVDSISFSNYTTYTPFKRTILIVIDALRFDFVLPSNSENHYLNQFPILSQLQLTHPESSLLFQFRADPPTTTMQRVKGLMTGSLPTFIDAGANFASSAVGEDHLLDHIKNKFEKIYLFGDDTWLNLFPSVFHPNRTFESDSFKMLDLDSVDDHIETHLWPSLKEDWDFIIAHYLGVDHCGHTFGPSDPNMKRKLNQMNEIIKKLVSNLDDDTLLVVMGDHGMTVDGDHGGDSIEELTSTLFLHSNRPLKNLDLESFYKEIHHQRSTLLDYDFKDIKKKLNYETDKHPMVAQIHLVPTLAYLLNVSSPFGNLGAILPELVYADTKDKTEQLIHLTEQFRKNALQVHDYFNKYDQQTHQLDFSKDKLKPITQHLLRAESILSDLFESTDLLKISTDQTDERLKEAILAYDAFLMHAIKYCAAIWAQFDAGSMLLGIVVLGASTLISLWHSMNATHENRSSRRGFVAGATCTLIGASIVFLRYVTFSEFVLRQGWFDKLNKMDWIGTVIVLTLFCVMLASTGFELQSHSADFYLSWLVVLFQALSLGSNSFVVWEDRSTRFFLMTLSCFWLARQLKSLKEYRVLTVMGAVIRPLVFMTFIRILSLTGQCREEQYPYCDYFLSSSLEFRLDNLIGRLTIGVLFGSFATMICLTSSLLDHGRVIPGLYQASGVFTVLRMAIDIGHRTVQSVEKSELEILFQTYADLYIPRLIYVLCSTGIVLILVYPDVLASSVPHNKRNIKLWSIMLLSSMMLALLQRPFGTFVMIVSPVLFALLNTGDRDTLTTRLCIVYFLGRFLFFATGHQATFTSLPWKAAFVGFEDMHYYTGMVLVTLSTVAGYIVSLIGWFYLSEEPTLSLLSMFGSMPTFLSAIFIFVLKRHLMTWKIFAPRFLLQVLLELASHLVVLFLVLKKSI